MEFWNKLNEFLLRAHRQERQLLFPVLIRSNTARHRCSNDRGATSVHCSLLMMWQLLQLQYIATPAGL